jgi:hypothetical protein
VNRSDARDSAVQAKFIANPLRSYCIEGSASRPPLAQIDLCSGTMRRMSVLDRQFRRGESILPLDLETKFLSSAVMTPVRTVGTVKTIKIMGLVEKSLMLQIGYAKAALNCSELYSGAL